MKNGKFTKEEREYLNSLSAVEKAYESYILYSTQFKIDCMKRYHAGESPTKIFDQAGLCAKLIGHKRIERAIFRWKETETQDALSLERAPLIRRSKRIESLKKEKRDAVEKQRKIRDKQVKKLEAKLEKERQRSKRREQEIIAAQAAQIKTLKAQVKALKVNGALAKKTKRAPYATEKTERFELIFQLKNEDANFNVKAACEALEVSRSGYYEWVNAAPAREKREQQDLVACEQISKALNYRGVRKGSREVKDCMRRKQNIVMNRKKILRISKKYDLIPKPKRKRPYQPIGTDGQPKIADNVVNRDFRKGAPLMVVSTDITYLPNKHGFSYLSAALDCETNVLLSHVTSESMEEEFVIETFGRLRGITFPKGACANSDQGVQYQAKAYREILAELDLIQSMSRKACCWDNAPIESFWSRLKSAIGPTNNLEHEEIVKLVDNYIDYYNNERGQARLGWLTPTEYAKSLTA